MSSPPRRIRAIRLALILSALALAAVSPACDDFFTDGGGIAFDPCDPDTHRDWCHDRHTLIRCIEVDGVWTEWSESCGQPFGEPLRCDDDGSGAVCTH